MNSFLHHDEHGTHRLDRNELVIEYDMIKTNLIFLYPKGTF